MESLVTDRRGFKRSYLRRKDREHQGMFQTTQEQSARTEPEETFPFESVTQDTKTEELGGASTSITVKQGGALFLFVVLQQRDRL